MTLQTICQIIIAIGIIMTAAGSYGSYHFGKAEQAIKDKEHEKESGNLKIQIDSLHAMTTKIAEQNDLIYSSTVGSNEEWHDVEMKHVPDGVADYLMLLFASNIGRITGKIRIKGASEETTFSTTANNKVPVALRNLWVPELSQYKTPTIMQFMIANKTHKEASLSIYTQGWIDTRGTEPH